MTASYRIPKARAAAKPPIPVPEGMKSLVLQWRFLPSGRVKKWNVPEAIRDDAESEGYVALCRAAGRYDSSRAEFSTFATRLVDQAIWQCVKDYNCKWANRFWTESALGEQQVDRHQCECFFSQVAKDEPSVVDQVVASMDDGSVVAEFLSRLQTISYSDTIAKRFGLSGRDPMTYLEIAEEEGVSKERVRQKVAEGLKHYARKYGIDIPTKKVFRKVKLEEAC